MTSSKIFFYSCLFFIGGIFFSSFFYLPQLLIVVFLVLGIFLIFLFFPIGQIKTNFDNYYLFLVGFCFLFLALGVWRYQVADSKVFYPEKEKPLSFKGVIVSEPKIKGKGLRLIVEPGKDNDEKVEGKVLIITDPYLDYQYGDKLEIKGVLKKPPIFEDFNYRDFLKKDGVYSLMIYPEIKLLERNQGNFLKGSLISFKNNLEISLNKIMPRPHSAILEALFFGEEQNISEEWKNKLNLTGVRHLTAVSGMNITIITILILNFLLAFGFWRSQAFYLSIVLVILYILMIGAPPSAVRAGIMALLLLSAQYFGRASAASRLIIFAAALMLLQNPFLLKLDVGFQLSFLATMGLIHLQATFLDWFKKIPNLLQLRNNLAATLSAQIFALPLLIYNFGQVSLISPLTNILILPLIPFLTIFGFIFSFIGIFWQSFAQILAFFAWFLISYILKIVEISSQIPFASFIVKEVHWTFLIISYLILGIAVWLLKENQKLKFLKY